ncbi:MAG: ribose-phosphate pyrophosphokinase [Parachlamydiaceae bacterium]|nr:ribose-phosphate pyrophosphokinase [Parachlamydiaceae bacterium]
MLVLAGSSHPELAQQIAECLGVQLGKLSLGRFPDGEVSLRILESVRGQDIFVVQTIALDPDRYLMELLVIIDALKRASARSINAVIPYFGYCRQDRKNKPREPITAKLVADLLTSAGATHIVTMDLHAGQLEGFFNIPVDHIHGMPVLVNSLKELGLGENCVVVAPDVGSVKQARSYASALNADFAVVAKRRLSVTEVESSTLIGEVKGKVVLLADDMCSTGGTLVSAAKACQEKGASRIFAAVTHGLLLEGALSSIEESPIEALYMSNTIPYTDRLATSAKLKIQSVAPSFAHAIRCITSQEPLFLENTNNI